MAIVYKTPSEIGRGRVDRKRLLSMTEEEIMRTSPPELANLPDDFWDNAVVVEPISKEPISLRVDEDVLEWFRKGGPRYQSRMNAVLRSYMKATINRSRSKQRRPSRVAEDEIRVEYNLRGSKPNTYAARLRKSRKKVAAKTRTR
jgi:uncharacterized protein (DUF4415 family)